MPTNPNWVLRAGTPKEVRRAARHASQVRDRAVSAQARGTKKYTGPELDYGPWTRLLARVGVHLFAEGARK